MEMAPQITYRHMQPSDLLRERVEERVERLEERFGRITSCHVVVDAPQHRRHTGDLYEARVEVRVPGRALVVSGRPGDVKAHHDVLVAVRDAFDVVERDLARWREQADGEVKVHAAPVQGRVAELRPERDFGRVETVDGRLVYFHRHAVIDAGFDGLALGDTVELSVDEEESAEGPQAAMVRRIGALRLDPTRT